jgi:hypothetical protein
VGGGWQRFRSWTFAIPGYYSCSAQTNVYIYTVAAAVSDFLESLPRVASSQVRSSSSRGFARACRVACLISAVLPRI